MNVVTQEYQNLINRQEAIKQDMLGVAAAIEKLDNSFGKNLIAQIGSITVNSIGSSFGVPIKIQIPTQFAYATLGVFGIIPTIRDSNKMKKYVARIKELETEYNDITLKLQEIDSKVMYDAQDSNNGKKLSSGNQSPTNSPNPYYVVIVLALLGILIYFLVRNK
jgi:hypothetical protein